MSDDLPIFDPESGEPEVIPPVSTPVPRVTLQQFCDHFTTCKRTLLAGFKAQELKADREVDTVEAYSARLAKFHKARLG